MLMLVLVAVALFQPVRSYYYYFGEAQSQDSGKTRQQCTYVMFYQEVNFKGGITKVCVHGLWDWFD